VTDTYMPDPERTVDYQLLAPGFTKVFAFGTQFGQIGYIIADSWEDAYEELLDHAYEVDGECDHGDDPDYLHLLLAAESIQHHSTGDDDTDRVCRQDAWEAVWSWVDEHCDCEHSSNGRVWMVDSWWLSNGERGLPMTPLELVTALRAITRDPELNERLDTHIEWYTEDADEDA
jgi:hypothetical protein